METFIKECHPNPTEQDEDLPKTESAENFQKFIYELFDKNGILNDLRAYLRGHIVNVLKSAQTGDPPSCQKHFTQRLHSTFQALNMLVAEYLLCLEFNYSLSVFVSEIPLANMKFGLAKALMDLGVDGEATGLRFGENDVWSILNYLGIKCDCENANRILDMYNSQVKTPLLLCILKCVQLCEMEQLHSVSSHDGSISTSSKSSNTDKRSSQCKHYAFCKTCRRRYRRLKEKYGKKKKHYIQNAQVNAQNLDSIMKNVGDLERSLVDEMFEQLKTAYEAEIDMFKADHEGRLKSSLASHVQHFQQMQNELEESFKAREAVLEANMVHKKRFLWGLAQALRIQHSQMSKAMQAVKKHTALLADQEKSLKVQQTEAAESLKKHGEEMRQQIADELAILECHLESMKAEREIINRDRLHLDKVNSDTKMTDAEIKNYLQTHYHLMKDELDRLKLYIENATFQPKSVVERSTITEDEFYRGMMNNETGRGLAREEVRPHQVVNDLKKQKNVNFSQCKLERESHYSRSGSSSSEDLCRHHTETERQRHFPRQDEQDRQAPQWPAPPAAPSRLGRSTQGGTSESSRRAGAGEEHGLLASAPVLSPGDALPFVGVVGQRRADCRRHLPGRGRALRPRASPLAAELAARAAPVDTPAAENGIRIRSPSSESTRHNEESRQEEEAALSPTRDNLRPKATTSMGSQKTGEKSPRSLLKEAKEKLKTVTRASASREKSPGAMLREAKLRLRKLEIEAEAVERSYMDFRRRRELRRPDRDDEQSSISHPVSRLETHYKEEIPGQSKSMNFDLDKYLKKYQINLYMGQEHFRSKNTAAELAKPVPNAYSEINRTIEPILRQDYLEKPISEFRKLYYSNPAHIHATSPTSVEFQDQVAPSSISCEKALEEKCSELRNEKNNKRKELEILKQNISKIYDLQDEPTKETIEMTKPGEEINMLDNLLTVEVEDVNEVRDLKVNSSQGTDLLVVVKGSVDSKELVSEYENSKEEISTNIVVVISPKKPGSIDDTNIRAASETTRSPSPARKQSFSRSIITKEFYEASGDKEFPHDNIPVEIHNDPDSEIHVQLDPNQISETDEAPEDYPDDFSYDVDNYKSEYDNSPISLPKTSEDEIFWD